MYPSVPCTRIRCPSRISRVACSTPTTAGKAAQDGDAETGIVDCRSGSEGGSNPHIDTSPWRLTVDCVRQARTIPTSDRPQRPRHLRMHLCLLYARAVRVVMS